MEHDLDTALELPLSIEEVFAFFADAGNLERITPPELDFRIVSPRPIDLRRGALIEYRLRLRGIPFRWVSRISDWDPPRRFVDEQVRGPYARWIHTHSFEPTASGTTIRDHVRYALPLGPIGDMAHPLVRAQLSRIFEFRKEAVSLLLLPGRRPARLP